MSERRFDVPSFLFGMFCCFICLYIIVWASIYGYDFFNQYKQLIGGFIMGFVIMYCIHKIDWSVGF